MRNQAPHRFLPKDGKGQKDHGGSTDHFLR